MNLCRVTGDIVSTVKNHHLNGEKLLTVQPVELDGKTPRGPSFIALDQVQAGVSDLVLTIQEGGGTRIIYQNDQTPAEAVVVAVVDELEVSDWDSLVGLGTLEQPRGDA